MKQSNYEIKFIQDDWDDPARWDKFYTENMDDKLLSISNPRYLIRSIKTLNLSSPLKILNAGSGISFLADLAAHMGHRVVAIDISQVATSICQKRKVSKRDLEKCLGYMYNLQMKYVIGVDYIDPKTKKKVDIHNELQKLYNPGGKIIARETFDWNDPGLLTRHGTFDIILNRNGLRNASLELIKKSFSSFYKLLNPGGLLIVSNSNAIVRLNTIESIAKDTGFELLHEMDVIHEPRPDKIKLRPDTKYALFGWPTG